MLIRTETDENALPLDAVVILADGVAAQLDVYSGTITDESQRGRRFWRTTGSTYINSPLPDRLLPAVLVSPRRYGDEELGTVAAAIETRRQLSPRADSITLARAALDALEEK